MPKKLNENVIVIAVPHSCEKSADGSSATLKLSAVISLHATLKPGNMPAPEPGAGPAPDPAQAKAAAEALAREEWKKLVKKQSSGHATYLDQCRHFRDWPGTTGLPWMPEKTMTVQVVKDGWARGEKEVAMEVDGSLMEVNPPTLDRTRLERLLVNGNVKVEAKHSAHLWQSLFGDCSVPEQGCWISPDLGDSKDRAGTATNPDTLRAAVRNLDYSVEGITSDEMNALVAGGLALQAVTPKNEKKPVREEMPQAALGTWYRALEVMNQVIERQDQLGAAGARSAALEKELDAAKEAGGGGIPVKASRRTWAANSTTGWRWRTITPTYCGCWG